VTLSGGGLECVGVVVTEAIAGVGHVRDELCERVGVKGRDLSAGLLTL
jgi:hypothetical protein